jgi:predicted permease
VAHVAAANALPFVSLGNGVGFEMPSPTDPAVKQQVQASLRSVSPDYFRALGLRLVAGRLLADSDSATTSPVVVVNRSFARRYLGEVPLGMRVPLRFERDRSQVQVVGVVDDMHQSSVTDPSAPELFVSYRQVPTWMVRGALIFVARTGDDPLAHVATLRAAVREQDAAVVLDDVMTMEERVRSSLAKPRLYAVLLTMLALAAAAIAGVGLFGVLSYAVAQRSREIGLRTALGAQQRDIVSLVLTQSAAVASAGVIVGLALSFALTKYLATFLYGVSTHDAISYAVVAVALMIVAGIASVVPARRAARVDPLTALRAD